MINLPRPTRWVVSGQESSEVEAVAISAHGCGRGRGASHVAGGHRRAC
jgi:hypothetical protein